MQLPALPTQPAAKQVGNQLSCIALCMLTNCCTPEGEERTGRIPARPAVLLHVGLQVRLRARVEHEQLKTNRHQAAAPPHNRRHRSQWMGPHWSVPCRSGPYMPRTNITSKARSAEQRMVLQVLYPAEHKTALATTASMDQHFSTQQSNLLRAASLLHAHLLCFAGVGSTPAA